VIAFDGVNICFFYFARNLTTKYSKEGARYTADYDDGWTLIYF